MTLPNPNIDIIRKALERVSKERPEFQRLVDQLNEIEPLPSPEGK